MSQVPDSRRAILELLKRSGALTIAQLAESLQLTGEGVRQHLLQLQREGFVEAKGKASGDRPRTGRPATYYQLTVAGEHRFPKRYDVLAMALIDAMTDEFGVEAAKNIMGRVTDKLVHTDEPKVEGLSLEDRIEVMKNWYGAGDQYMEVERVDGNYRMIERNCPFINVAMQRPALCSVSINSLTRLLGFRVTRDESFQHGFGRCVFLVHAQEPVESDSWEFTLEES